MKREAGNKKKDDIQLDIFSVEVESGLAGAEAPFEEAKPTRKRKGRKAKKAPMLLDSFVPDSVKMRGVEPSPETTSEGETPSPVSHEGPTPRIFTVSELTSSIKNLLESSIPDVWLTGEVTDYKNRVSKHLYFSIKDNLNKVRAVIFNTNNKIVPFELKDGLEVVVHGKLNVYGPAGYYSIIVDYIEPKGIGALQLAFEQLKKKLEAEGLFDAARKKPLPYLPRKIGVVTSPTGAAIRDIVHVLTRRFPNIEILLNPVRVQGDGAANEIAAAITEMNLRSDLDLLIVGRGGGSIEDLWAFNEEIVARAIFASRIPIISAVGHEIDFTIADFVADKRAATPSAAAEIAVPKREDLIAYVSDSRRKLSLALSQVITNRAHELRRLMGRLTDPRKRLPDLILRVDNLRQRIVFAVRVGLEKHTQALSKLASNLNHLSPLGVLAKGYAVVEGAGGTVVRASTDVNIGDAVSIRLHKGLLGAKVVSK